MKKALLFSLGMLALAAGASSLRAQGGTALPAAFQPYDVDQDGKLSREEWQAWLEDSKEGRPPNQWDINRDGYLSADEITAGREAIRRRLELKFQHRFYEADLDEDSKLSLEEFSRTVPKDMTQERILKVFRLIDGNGDGYISLTEFLISCGLRKAPAPPPPLPRTPVP